MASKASASLTPARFSSSDVGSVNIQSSWKKTKDTFVAETQTSAIQTMENESQTAVYAEAEVQTEEDSGPLMADDCLDDFEKWEPPRDVEEFLHRVGPTMLKQLEANSRSRVNYEALSMFKYDRDGGSPDDEDDNADVKCIHRLSFDVKEHLIGTEDTQELEDLEKLQVTGVSWNCTGSAIAVAYGRNDLSGWCDIPGFLCVWNVFKNQSFKANKPDVVLDTPTCLSSVAFHPVQPSIVIAGSFNGEILMWDLNQDECLVASSTIDDYYHREPVSKVLWVHSMSEQGYHIVSVSGDGKVLMWSNKEKMGCAKLQCPSHGFTIEKMGKSREVAPRRGRSRDSVVGGSTIAFQSDGRNDSIFVVGTEGGSLLRGGISPITGSMLQSGKLKWAKDAEALVQRLGTSDQSVVVKKVEDYVTHLKKKGATRTVALHDVFASRPATIFTNPINFTFDPHIGPVHAVVTSPFHRNLFFSAGSDGVVRLNSLLQPEPLLHLDPAPRGDPSPRCLYSLECSRFRPLVFAVGSNDGNVFVFDLKKSITFPAKSLDCNPPTRSGKSGRQASRDKSAVLCMSFNPKARALLAAGTSAGEVLIWKLPWHLSNMQEGEDMDLNECMVNGFNQAGQEGDIDGENDAE